MDDAVPSHKVDIDIAIPALQQRMVTILDLRVTWVRHHWGGVKGRGVDYVNDGD